MAIEYRNGNAYYYRSIRCGQRVDRLYLGSGPAAELAAAEAESRAVRRELARLEREELGEWRRSVRDLTRAALAAVTGHLAGLGYRRVGARRWRRKRAKGDAMDMALAGGQATGALATAGHEPPKLDPLSRLRVENAVGCAGLPDEVRARMADGTERHARELAGPAPSPAEWELAIFAAIVRHDVAFWESRLARWNTVPNLPAAFDREAQHVDRLRRRYASLLRTLADVRRMQTAALVQVGTVNVQNNINATVGPNAADGGAYAGRLA